MHVHPDQIRPVTFRKGEILFRENDQSFHFYIIQEGQVEVYKTADDGSKIPLAVVSDGASIGEFAMIDRLPRSASAAALGDVTAVEITERAYQQLLSDLPEWAVSIMRSLVERLRHTNEIVRCSKLVDERFRQRIDSIEYDPEASGIRRLEGAPEAPPSIHDMPTATATPAHPTIESIRDALDDDDTPDLA